MAVRGTTLNGIVCDDVRGGPDMSTGSPFFQCRREAELYCAEQGWDRFKVWGKLKSWKWARQRQQIWHHLRATGYQYKVIADVFKRNHTTIISGVRRYDQENQQKNKASEA